MRIFVCLAISATVLMTFNELTVGTSQKSFQKQITQQEQKKDVQ